MLRVNKERKFQTLVENIDRCSLCRRMQDRYKVLSEKNGSIDSPVLFIGEAPGRLGADRTHIPFHGDQAGKNFERLLVAASLTRDEVFVTNAVLCNPRDEKGNNAAPTMDEIRNCSLYLSLLLDIIQPDFIVSLGRWALNALDAIESHSIELRRDVRKPVKWTRYTVLPMYHPGPRASVHRNINDQIRDFMVLGEVLGHREPEQEQLGKGQLPLLDSFEASLLQKVIFRIVHQLGTVSKFKLTKLLYLLDWREVKAHGNVLTGCYYLAQADGPVATGLSQSLEEMVGGELSFRFVHGSPTYSLGDTVRCDIKLPSDIVENIDTLLIQCRSLTDAQIKTKAYLTEPMKGIIRRKRKGERMLNHPVFEGWIPPKIK